MVTLKQVQHVQLVQLNHQHQQLLHVLYVLMQLHVLHVYLDIMFQVVNVYHVKLDVHNVKHQVIYAQLVLLDIIYKMEDVLRYNQIV